MAIRVNMTPCEDVQTIHASQNDGEARQWEFDLHNNGEKIDSSSISDQLVFKAYEGGTEEILPENGSVPTTSPIIADIKYPQGLLTDQEFTYRQSPTESDGLAFIEKIKGNTLNWNQLVRNGNFADTSFWGPYAYRFTFSVASNKGTFVTNGSDPQIRLPIVITSGHKYLFMAKMENGANVVSTYIRAFQNFSTSQVIVPIGTALGQFNYVFTASNNFNIIDIRGYRTNNQTLQTDDSFILSNVMLIDLTQMGLDISNPSDFTSLFSLPYYDYNAGTLLSFNGTGIKTVGKNQLKMPSSATLNGLSFNVGTDGKIQITGTATAQTDFYLYGASGRYDDMGIISSTYTFSCRKDSATTGLNFFLVSQQLGTRIGVQLDTTSLSQTVALDGSDKYRVFMRVANGTTINTKVALQLELGASVTDYEPYTSSTLSLPISTYFPTGMKSAGSVYDELTETKAITRIGSVDLGTLTWQLNGTRMQADIGTIFSNWNYNQECAKYTSNEAIAVSSPSIDKIMGVYRNRILIYDSSFADPTAFGQSVSGVYLYYELSAPTETSFTTASLVTENGEIPLSNEDGVLIGKCTEQLSSESGFFDAKIKLADEDGECYSNKIQLHIERKPS